MRYQCAKRLLVILCLRARIGRGLRFSQTGVSGVREFYGDPPRLGPRRSALAGCGPRIRQGKREAETSPRGHWTQQSLRCCRLHNHDVRVVFQFFSKLLICLRRHLSGFPDPSQFPMAAAACSSTGVNTLLRPLGHGLSGF